MNLDDAHYRRYLGIFTRQALMGRAAGSAIRFIINNPAQHTL